MLPSLRAVFAGMLAAFALLIAAFGAVAMLRVAQGQHGVLQADLARQGRDVPPAMQSAPHRITVIDTPGPHLAPPPTLPVVAVRTVPVGAEVPDTPVETATNTLAVAPPVSAELPTQTAAEPAIVAAPREDAVQTLAPPQPAVTPRAPAIGGPLAAAKPEPSEAERAAARAARAKKVAAAKRMREARLARQRKIAAARRAAAAKYAKQQQPATTFNSSFGNTGFGNVDNSFGTRN